VDHTTGTTDDSGHFTFSALDGLYYQISINSGEYTYIWQATSNNKDIYLTVPVTLTTSTYGYTTSYNSTNSSVLVTYTDVNIANVNISVIDTLNGIVVQQKTYTGVTSITSWYHDAASVGEYKIQFDITRVNGIRYQDTKFVRAPGRFGIDWGPDGGSKNIWIYGLVVFAIILVATSLGGMASRIGAIILVGFATALTVMGFLPQTIQFAAALGTAWLVVLLILIRSIRGGD
jgi:hypothetical protein